MPLFLQRNARISRCTARQLIETLSSGNGSNIGGGGGRASPKFSFSSSSSSLFSQSSSSSSPSSPYSSSSSSSSSSPYHVNGTPQNFPHPWDNGPPRRERAEDRKHVAVVGGGITGLAAAYSLVDGAHRPGRGSIKVTVYEGSGRVGGWLDSQRTPVSAGASGGGEVVFETGPRTLRPTPFTAALLTRLGFALDDVIPVSQSAPAAQNRFVYYPDALVKLPGPATPLAEWLEFLTSPIMKGIPFAAVRELLTKYEGPKEDMSVGQLLARRFDPNLADLASAMTHGIYAGDIYSLSAAAIFPEIHKDVVVRGGLLRGMLKQFYMDRFKRQREVNVSGNSYMHGLLLEDHLLEPPSKDTTLEKASQSQELQRARDVMIKAINETSVFTLKKGLGELARRLEEELRKNPDVTIIPQAKVSGIEVQTGKRGAVTIKASGMQPRKFTQAICTIPSASLAPLISAPKAPVEKVARLRELLSYNPSVTVMVVNLYFREPKLLPVEGFGYLIPRHIPLEQNPEGALGVVFDSDTIGDLQDDTPTKGTKISVLMGGHWWDWMKELNAWPSKEKGLEMARKVIKRHLNITASPAASKVTLQKDCIPQYRVGHRERMAELHDILIGDGFGGNLMVNGSSYQGVSVNDCIFNGAKAARMASLDILDSGLASPTAGYCMQTWSYADVEMGSKGRIRVR